MKYLIIVILLICQISCDAQSTKQSIAVRKFITPYQKDADDTARAAYLSVKGDDNYRNDSEGKAVLNYKIISYSGKIVGYGSISTTFAQYSAWPTDGDEVNNYPFELVAAAIRHTINSGTEIRLILKNR